MHPKSYNNGAIRALQEGFASGQLLNGLKFDVVHFQALVPLSFHSIPNCFKSLITNYKTHSKEIEELREFKDKY